MPGKIVEAREQLQWVWKVLIPHSFLSFIQLQSRCFDKQGTWALLYSSCVGNDEMQAPCSRDVLLLDIALDNYLRTLLERQDKGSLEGDDLFELISLSLRNAIIAIDSEDLRQVRHYMSLFPLNYYTRHAC